MLVKGGDYFSHGIFHGGLHRHEGCLHHLAVHPWASYLPSLYPCFPHLYNEDNTTQPHGAVMED